ncbi:hypothetical protein ONS95_009544 [Cadophora gregata]|uniref:uncharacterized protein n=1 Tax=Cadophora gregata TaxID=51156 RepID=UPI0026DCBDE1|nr:uncharacterized protein ONS95_009544 [Cadophora gregata]KAK0124595.1 hypothetical protein ONS95_009544 [Cadophora gregata]KAK0129548.1 hypothetical protein ONS96_000113 [Cadophora gregata f. sp. sojae]
MGASIQGSTRPVLFSIVGILSLIILVLGSIWFYRLYTTRGFHLTDFERLSKEARHLAQETDIIRKDILCDSFTSEESVRIANMEHTKAAEDLDCGIRIALSAWEDIMQPDEGDALDEEAAVGGMGSMGRKVERRLRERRKSHGRYVIGLMRGKAMEGLERRKELSRGLQAMHLEILSRKTDVASSLANYRFASGGSKSSIMRKAMPKKFRSHFHPRPDSRKSARPSSPLTQQHTPEPEAEPMSPTATSAMLPSIEKDESCPAPGDKSRDELLGSVQKENVQKQDSRIQVRFAAVKDV